jgi:hypothetical protein
MALIFGAHGAGETADDEQTVTTLADGWCTGGPLQDRLRLDEQLGPALRKLREAAQYVFLDFVLEPHGPVQLKVMMDSIA